MANPRFTGNDYDSARDRAILDEAMGIKRAEPIAVVKGTLLVMNGMATPADAERHLAAVRELASTLKISEDEATRRILARSSR